MNKIVKYSSNESMLMYRSVTNKQNVYISVPPAGCEIYLQKLKLFFLSNLCFQKQHSNIFCFEFQYFMVGLF